MRRSIYIVAIVCVLAEQAWAEDKPQVGLFFNGSRAVSSKADLTYRLIFMNFVYSYLPYAYLGLNFHPIPDFKVEVVSGYGFEVEKKDRGLVNGIIASVNLGRFNFNSDVEYYAGLDCIFSYFSLSYPVSFLRVGIDNRNFYYLDKEDSQKRVNHFGPSVKILFSEQASVKLVYFYSFERDGANANIFRMVLNINL